MVTVAEAFVTIRPDLGKFGSETERELQGANGALNKFGNDAKAGLDGATKSAGGFGSAIGGVGKVVAGFVAANVLVGAASKITGFFSDSVGEAIKLGESVNAVNKIFGESASVIQKWGKENATNFGLSAQSFNVLATPLGAIMKNAGIPMEQVTNSTINLTKRAADMASVFNTDVKTALDAIMSGLKGEANPLEQFGVGVTAAKVEAQALADTGKTLTSELTDLEKMTARINLIMKETATSEGDFADTSKEAANAARIQQARMEELQATIGQKLLPVQLLVTQAKLAMVDAIATKVLPAIEKMIAFMGPALTPVLVGIAAVVGTVLVAAFVALGVAIWGAVAPLLAVAAPFIAVGVAIAALVAGLIYAYQNWDLFRNAVNAVVSLFQSVVLVVFKQAEEAIRLFGLALAGGSIGGSFNIIEKAAFALGGVFRDHIVPAFNAAKDAFHFFVLALTGGDAGGQMTRLQEIALSLGATMRKVWEEISASVSHAVQVIGGFLREHQEVWSAIFTFILDFVRTKIEGVIQVISGIVEVVSGVVNLVSALFHGEWAAAWDAMQQIAGGIVDIFIGYIKTQFGNIPEILLGLVGQAADAAGRLAQGIYDAVVRVLEKLPGKMAQLGTNAANSFLNSISVAGVSVGDITGISLLRHGGGPVEAGRPYLVGKTGAEELFVPRSAGSIIPHGLMGGEAQLAAPSFIFNVENIYARDQQEAEESAGFFAWGLMIAAHVRGD